MSSGQSYRQLGGMILVRLDGAEGKGSQCLMGAVTLLQDGKNFVNGGCDG